MTTGWQVALWGLLTVVCEESEHTLVPISPAVQERIDEAFEIDPGFEDTLRLQAFGALVEFLARETVAGGLTDPSTCGAEAWQEVRHRIPIPVHEGKRGVVERLYLACWEAMTGAQLKASAFPFIVYRYNRAFEATALAYNRLATGDRGSAIRWAVLSHYFATTIGYPEGGSLELLSGVFGVPGSFIGAIEMQAKSIASDLQQSAWHQPDVLLVELLKGPQSSYLMLPTLQYEHELNKPLFEALLCDALSDSSGRNLESLAAYLLSLVPGYRLRAGVLASDFACEHDVVAVPTANATPLVHGKAGAVLVECKNWNEKIGSAVVGYLHARMLVTGCQIGVLISKRGPTSMRTETGIEEKAGLAMMRRLFHETGNVIISINEDDLVRIGQLGSFRTVVEERAEEFVYGRQHA